MTRTLSKVEIDKKCAEIRAQQAEHRRSFARQYTDEQKLRKYKSRLLETHGHSHEKIGAGKKF
jgi:hypothetical protein